MSQFSFGQSRNEFWLTFILAFFGVAFILAKPLLGYGPHGDEVINLLALCLVGICAAALWLSRDTIVSPYIKFFIGLMALFVLPRIFLYLTANAVSIRQLYILFPLSWNAEALRLPLLFFVLGTLLFLIGLVLPCYLFRWSKRQRAPVKLRHYRTSSYIISFAVITLVDSYFTLYLGMNASANCILLNQPFSWLIHFFSNDVFLSFVACALLMDPKLTKRDRIVLLGIVGCYLVLCLLGGSRGGPLRFAFILFAVWCFGDTGKLTAKKLLATALLLLCLGIPSYFAGTMIRAFLKSNCAGETLTAGTLTGEFTDRSSSYIEKFHPPESVFWAKDRRALNLPDSLAAISDRFSVLDFAIGIVAVPANEVLRKKYFNLSHLLKNFTNNMVLGEPYPENHYYWANMHSGLYRNLPESEAAKDYKAEPFLLWGMAFIFGGYWWGLILMLVSGVAFFGFAATLAKRAHYPLIPFCIVLNIWFFFNGLYLFQMSFDHSSTVFVYLILQTLTTIGLLESTDFLLKKS